MNGKAYIQICFGRQKWVNLWHLYLAAHLRQDIERVRERSRVDVDPFAALEMVARLEEQLEQEIRDLERFDDSDDNDEEMIDL